MSQARITSLSLTHKSEKDGEYFGQLNSLKVKDGFGQLQRKDGIIVQGEWKNGELNGPSIVQKVDEQFFGNFKEGKRHGIGCHDYNNKTFLTKYVKGHVDDTFASELQLPGKVFMLGKIDSKSYEMNGYGEIDEFNKEQYIRGFFRRGILDGFGKIENKKFNKIGDFVNGLLCGVGKITYANGDYILADFQDENPVGFTIETFGDEYYCGNYDKDRERVGHAIIKKKGEFEYVGEIAQGGTFHGHGKERDLQKNWLFIGTFEEGKKVGVGYLERHTKDETGEDIEIVYYGEFTDGLPNGLGVEKVGFEERFVGPFKNGIRNGKGMLFNKSTMSLEPAYFKRGKHIVGKALDRTKLVNTLKEYMDKEPAIMKQSLSKVADDIEFVLEGKKKSYENSPNLDLEESFKRASETLRKKRELLMSELKKKTEMYKPRNEEFKEACSRNHDIEIECIDLNDIEIEEGKQNSNGDSTVDLKLAIPMGIPDDDDFGKPAKSYNFSIPINTALKKQHSIIQEADENEEETTEREMKKAQEMLEIKEEDEEEDDKIKLMDGDEVLHTMLEPTNFKKRKRKTKAKSVKEGQAEMENKDNYKKVRKLETRKYGKFEITRKSKDKLPGRKKMSPKKRRRKPKRKIRKKTNAKKKVILRIIKKVHYEDNPSYRHYVNYRGNKITEASDHPFYSKSRSKSKEGYYNDYGIDSARDKWNNSMDKLMETDLNEDDKLLEYDQFFDGPGSVTRYVQSPDGKKGRKVYRFNKDDKLGEREIRPQPMSRSPGPVSGVSSQKQERWSKEERDLLQRYGIPQNSSKSRKIRRLERLGITDEAIIQRVLDADRDYSGSKLGEYVALKPRDDDEYSGSPYRRANLDRVLKSRSKGKRSKKPTSKKLDSRDKEWMRIVKQQHTY